MWAVAAIVAAGAALRFSTLDLQSFWDDEAVTVGTVLAPSLWSTLGHIPSSEASPPLYYVLAWLWTPLVAFPEPAAYLVWTVLCLGAYVWAWHIAAPFTGLL